MAIATATRPSSSPARSSSSPSSCSASCARPAPASARRAPAARRSRRPPGRRRARSARPAASRRSRAHARPHARAAPGRGPDPPPAARSRRAAGRRAAARRGPRGRRPAGAGSPPGWCGRVGRARPRRATDAPRRRSGASRPRGARRRVQLERLQRGQLVGREQAGLQRHPDRHDLQHAARAGRQRVQAGADELRQAHPAGRRAVPAPDATGVVQHAALDAVQDELAQEQRVAPGQLPQGLAAASVQRTSERRLEQPLDVGARQLHELEQRTQLVLPQRPQRIGHGLLVPYGDHREGLARGHDLMHERRGGIVEQLPVVDAEHEPSPARAIDERMTRPRQHVRAIRAAWIGRGQQRGERPQRDRCRRARRPYPLHGTAARARHARDLAGQPRLADTRGPGDHDAVRPSLPTAARRSTRAHDRAPPAATAARAQCDEASHA